jgi:DNA-binding FadR family transcriptional regulator
VGRRAVRQALEVLEAEGLLWRRQGKGTFVGQPPDPTGELAAEIVPATDPLSVMEARLCIEPALAALCAERASEADIERMRALAHRTILAVGADSTELWDGALHRLIARSAGNQILLTAFELVDKVRMQPDWQEVRLKARTPDLMQRYDGQHSAIIDAIGARDPKRARAAMTEHLSLLSHRLRLAMAETGR